MVNGKALEVLGALASYRGDGRCPACDGQVVEAVLKADGKTFGPESNSYWSPASPTHYICTVCDWLQALQVGIDWGATFDVRVIDRARRLRSRP